MGAATEQAGRHYAIVGGSSGIGLAVAKLLVARGDRVLIGGRSPDRLSSAIATLGDQASARPIAVSYTHL